MKHEFGYLDGIGRCKALMPLMNETYDSTFSSKPDVDEREYPWKPTGFSVSLEHVDEESNEIQQRTAEQVTHAMDSYASGADGWMAENIPYQFVSDRHQADVSIEFTPDPTISDGSIETNCDTDDELESHPCVTISVDRTDADRRGWHVGYWLGFAFGASLIDEFTAIRRAGIGPPGEVVAVRGSRACLDSELDTSELEASDG